jgi:hypothetical protein
MLRAPSYLHHLDPLPKDFGKAMAIDRHKVTTPLPSLPRNGGFSSDKIRELFRNEPGALKLKDENAAKKRKRSYVTLRIPPEVAQRVKRRLS